MGRGGGQCTGVPRQPPCCMALGSLRGWRGVVLSEGQLERGKEGDICWEERCKCVRGRACVCVHARMGGLHAHVCAVACVWVHGKAQLRSVSPSRRHVMPHGPPAAAGGMQACMLDAVLEGLCMHSCERMRSHAALMRRMQNALACCSRAHAWFPHTQPYPDTTTMRARTQPSSWVAAPDPACSRSPSRAPSPPSPSAARTASSTCPCPTASTRASPRSMCSPSSTPPRSTGTWGARTTWGRVRVGWGWVSEPGLQRA